MKFRLSGLRDAVDDEIQALINELVQAQADGLLSPEETALLQALQAEAQAPATTTTTLSPATTTTTLAPAPADNCCNNCRKEQVEQRWYISTVQTAGSVPVNVLRKRKTCESTETGNAKLACAEELAAFKRARGINGIRGLRGAYDDRM